MHDHVTSHEQVTCSRTITQSRTVTRGPSSHSTLKSTDARTSGRLLLVFSYYSPGYPDMVRWGLGGVECVRDVMECKKPPCM